MMGHPCEPINPRYCNANLESDAHQQLMKHFAARNLVLEWRGANYLSEKFGVQ